MLYSKMHIAKQPRFCNVIYLLRFINFPKFAAYFKIYINLIISRPNWKTGAETEKL